MNSYHRDVAKSRLASPEVVELKRRMNIAERLEIQEERLGEAEQQTATLISYLGGDPEEGATQDDGIPPGPPINLVAIPMPVHEIDVSWDPPDDQEAVTKSIAEVTPQGEPSYTVIGPAHFVAITNLLAAKPHSIRVMLEDVWGRQSVYSVTISATPPLTAAEQIDLDALAILGRIQGLLPNTNLATIVDAAKLATGIISEAKMADGAITQAKLGAGAVNAEKVADNAITTAKIAADAVKAAQLATGAVGSTELAAEAVVAGKIAAGTIQTADIAAGAVSAGKIAAGGVTATEIAAGSVVTSKIAANAVTASQIAANSIISGKIAAGAVLAQAIAVQDAAAINLWVQNAAIESAKIASIVADKITTGSIAVAVITLAASGKIKAGPQIKFDASGITMAPTPTEDESSTNVDYKISDSYNGRSVIHFYRELQANNYNRGIVLRAEGDAAQERSQIAIHAPYNNNAFNSNAGRLEVRSARTGANADPAAVVVAPTLSVQGDVGVDGGVQANNGITNQTLAQTSIGNGGGATWSHNFGAYPSTVWAWMSVSDGRKPLPHNVDNSLWIDWVSQTQIRIANNDGASRTCGGYLIRNGT